MNRLNCLTENWDEIIRFNDEFFPGWKDTEEVYYSNALAGEVGEVCNITKHRTNGGTKQKEHSDKELLEELADCFIYMELIIEKHDLDITNFSQAISDKVEKNRQRMNGRVKTYSSGRWKA